MLTEEQIYEHLNYKFGNPNMTLDLNLKKEWNYKKDKRLGGIAYIFYFNNGYKVSVIKNFGSYGNKEDKWELAIIKEEKLVNVPSIMGSDIVRGWLSDSDVESILEKVEKL